MQKMFKGNKYNVRLLNYIMYKHEKYLGDSR